MLASISALKGQIIKIFESILLKLTFNIKIDVDVDLDELRVKLILFKCWLFNKVSWFIIKHVRFF